MTRHIRTIQIWTIVMIIGPGMQTSARIYFEASLITMMLQSFGEVLYIYFSVPSLPSFLIVDILISAESWDCICIVLQFYGPECFVCLQYGNVIGCLLIFFLHFQDSSLPPLLRTSFVVHSALQWRSTRPGFYCRLTQACGIISVSIPNWLSIIAWGTVMKAGGRIVAINEFVGLRLHCTAAEVASGVCLAQTGEQVLEILGFRDLNTAKFMGVAVMIAVINRLIAWGILKLKLLSL